MPSNPGPYLTGYVPASTPTTTAATAPSGPTLASVFANAMTKGLDFGAQYLGTKAAADAAAKQAKAQITSANAAAMAAAAGSASPTAPTAPAWVVPAAIVAGALGLVALVVGILRR